MPILKTRAPKRHRTDRQELVMLRVTIAKFAQKLKVETTILRVVGQPYEQICTLARRKDRGWNSLLGECYKKIAKLKKQPESRLRERIQEVLEEHAEGDV